MIFTILISAGSFLFELTSLLADGVSPVTVTYLAALLIPGVVVKTFPMAMLLAALLAFGSLSGNSEIVALRAAGAGVVRMMIPVVAMGTAVALLAFMCDELIVPDFSRRALEVRAGIELKRGKRKDQNTSQPIMDGGRLAGYLIARDFRISDQTLLDADIINYDRDGQAASLFHVDKLIFTDLKHWRIEGKATLHSLNDGSKVELKDGAWPSGFRPLDIPINDLITRTLRDLDAQSMSQMKQSIDRMKAEANPDQSQIANLEFGYWNKVTVPLAALVFALVGAPLGIRSHRTGVATGFWLSVVIIFGYFMLTNAMSILARGGRFSPFAASFLPIAIGLGVGVYLVQKRNVQ